MPTREEYLAAAKERNALFFENYQEELAKEPFAKEAWSALVKAAPNRFITKVCMGNIDPKNIPDAEELVVRAACDENKGVDAASSWMNDYVNPPFREAIMAAWKKQFAEPDHAAEFLSKNSFVLMQALNEHCVANTIFHSVIPESVRRALSTHVVSEQDADSRKIFSQQIVSTTNRLHEEADPNLRYFVISKLDPEHLYELIGAGRAEIYTSGFKEFSRRLFASLPPPSDAPGNEKGLAAIMEASIHRKELMFPFLECCSSYGAMDKVMAALTPKQLDHMTDLLVDDIGHSKSPGHALTMLDILEKNKQPQLQKLLLEKIERAHRTEDRGAHDLFGMIASQYGARHADAPIFYKLTANEPRFRVPPADALPATVMTDAQGKHHQGYLFYNDKDGHDSFAHFMLKYKDTKKYKVTQHEGFVEINYQEGAVKMQLLAGKPDMGSNAMKSIDEFLAAQNPPAALQSFVHRGHSYHLSESMAVLGKRDIPLLVLGSCGGYTALSSVLENCPKAHIVATQGTGTMVVNDPLLKELNHMIAQGNGVQWDPLWKKLDQQITDPRFKEYINPSENRAIAFLKQTEMLLKEDKVYVPLQPRLNLPGARLEISLPDSLPAPPRIPAVPSPTTPQVPPR